MQDTQVRAPTETDVNSSLQERQRDVILGASWQVLHEWLSDGTTLNRKDALKVAISVALLKKHKGTFGVDEMRRALNPDEARGEAELPAFLRGWAPEDSLDLVRDLTGERTVADFRSQFGDGVVFNHFCGDFLKDERRVLVLASKRIFPGRDIVPALRRSKTHKEQVELVWAKLPKKDKASGKVGLQDGTRRPVGELYAEHQAKNRVAPTEVKTDDDPNRPSVHARESPPALSWPEARVRFVELLAEATHVTIAGFPPHMVTPLLEEALRKKPSGSFWERIKIVYLKDELLGSVDDDLSRNRPRVEAISERQQLFRAGHASLRNLLTHYPDSSWELYRDPFFPAFIGARFEVPGRAPVFLAAPIQPGESTDKHRFFVHPNHDSYSPVYANGLDRVVDRCEKWQEDVAVGAREARAFFLRRWQLRKAIMRSSDPLVWIPRVRVLLYRELLAERDTPPQAELVFQCRTRRNALSEENLLDHLGGFITPEDAKDCLLKKDYPPQANTAGADWQGNVNIEMFRNTVIRRLQEVGARSDWFEAPDPHGNHVGFVWFYGRHGEDWGRLPALDYVAAEPTPNFYFVLYKVRFTGPLGQLPPESVLKPLPLLSVLEVRRQQVLDLSLKALESATRRGDEDPELRALAANLILHGEKTLAEQLSGALQGRRPTAAVQESIREKKGSSGNRGSIPVAGLASFLYRGLFTELLDKYVNLGVAQAETVQDEINKDPDKSDAREFLTQYYRNPQTQFDV